MEDQIRRQRARMAHATELSMQAREDRLRARAELAVGGAAVVRRVRGRVRRRLRRRLRHVQLACSTMPMSMLRVVPNAMRMRCVVDRRRRRARRREGSTGQAQCHV